MKLISISISGSAAGFKLSGTEPLITEPLLGEKALYLKNNIIRSRVQSLFSTIN